MNQERNTEVILAERQKTHGSFESHARLSQGFKDLACNSVSWCKLDSAQRESLEMIFHKAARILNGDPNHEDHWADIAGYATLVSKDLKRRGMVKS